MLKRLTKNPVQLTKMSRSLLSQTLLKRRLLLSQREFNQPKTLKLVLRNSTEELNAPRLPLVEMNAVEEAVEAVVMVNVVVVNAVVANVAVVVANVAVVVAEVAEVVVVRKDPRLLLSKVKLDLMLSVLNVEDRDKDTKANLVKKPIQWTDRTALAAHTEASVRVVNAEVVLVTTENQLLMARLLMLKEIKLQLLLARKRSLKENNVIANHVNLVKDVRDQLRKKKKQNP